MHLIDEQFEDLLRENGQPDATRHLAECASCRQRLAEHQAIRARLRRAFSSVIVPAGLVEQIKAQVAQTNRGTSSKAIPFDAGRRPSHLSFRRRAWPALAAAAAILIVALPLTIYFATPQSATAAQMELVGIHRQNLVVDMRDVYSNDAPAKLAGYLKDKLGFEPAMPRLNQGMAIRGCCIAHFRDQIVGSYVVNTPHGLISIIVVKDQPQSLGLRNRLERDGQTIWTGSFATNSLAALRMGEFTYCAVGEVPADSLAELLALLLPPR